MNNLKIKISKGLKWSTLSNLIPKLISPLVMIFLTKFLLPENFGLVTSAMVIISFSQIIWEAGLTKALIQTNFDINLSANLVFWSNFFLSLVIYVIIFTFAPTISSYYNSPETTIILRILGIQIVLMSLTSVQEALFTKHLNFSPLFTIKLISSIFSGLISIILAILNFGVWALVLGTLTGVFVNLFLLIKKSNWRPSFKINFKQAKHIYTFGGWVFILSILGWIINWMDSLLVGKYFGIKELGIYRLGVTITSLIFSFLMAPISNVIFPTLSKFQNNYDEIQKWFNFINKVIISLVLPIGLSIFLLRVEIVSIFFNSNWQGLSIVIGLLCLSESIANLSGINPIILQAIGKADLQPKLSFLLIPFFIIVYWFVTPYGIIPLLWSKLILTLLTTPLNFLIMSKALNISPFYIVEQGKKAFIACVFLIMNILLIKSLPINNEFIILILSIITSSFLYIYILWRLDKIFINKLITITLNAIK